ncbi:glycine hydroxymethyltransferase [Nematocida major]|uniref:glycine hydroxymethyltransferase n=1 Tax=Nematocida major TaxID=1912982 RepID=UPI0020088778|nr:glycine hydroxymethyltransferase [Nematocida major]KAH9385235.1 glycine hydroxymethyltransferase [Nematocida major]
MSIECDRELQKYVDLEEERQKNSLTLIASENYVFPDVYRYSGSFLTNKYSEGRVGARYYGGTKYIDMIEELCQKRALALFGLDPSLWGVCVQPYSGSVANFSAYSAMIQPGGKIMGMNLPAGGHLTHGFQTKAKKISGTSLYFSSFPYGVDKNGELDYHAIRAQFNEVQPEILICGYSAHSQDINYAELKDIVGDSAFLYGDVSHISALIAAGLMNSPFEHCDVVMTTTHKGLRGPRGGIIFYRKNATIKGVAHNLEAKMHSAVFPLMQGGPHNQTIAGTAHAMYMASLPDFKEYARQVVSNAKVLEEFFTQNKYDIVTGSTVNHMIIVDLTSKGVTGAEVEEMCDIIGVSINKNTVPTDTSPFNPSGIRLGTYAITTRGFREAQTRRVAEVIHAAVEILQAHKEERAGVSVQEWMHASKIVESKEVADARLKVHQLAELFPVPE